MAYRGGGARGGDRGGDREPQYGGRRPGGRGGVRLPATTGIASPPPGPTIVYHNPAAAGPHQGAYQHGVVFRTPSPAPPAYPYAPAPVTVRSPSPPPSPTAAPFQPAHVSSGPKAPAPAPRTPMPSTAAIAKELEQKLFVSETALAPPAAAAAAAFAASQEGSAAASAASSDVDLAPVSKKGLAHPARPGPGTAGKKVMIRANHFLVNVADNNLFHYDVSSDLPLPCTLTPFYFQFLASYCMYVACVVQIWCSMYALFCFGCLRVVLATFAVFLRLFGCFAWVQR